MHYEIEYHRGGSVLQRFRTPISAAGMPVMQPVRAQLDQRLRPAVCRVNWQLANADTWRGDLWGSKGQPLGTLFAKIGGAA